MPISLSMPGQKRYGCIDVFRQKHEPAGLPRVPCSKYTRKYSDSLHAVVEKPDSHYPVEDGFSRYQSKAWSTQSRCPQNYG